MSLKETIAGFLSEAGTRLHILDGNTVQTQANRTDSPNTKTKSVEKRIYKSKRKTIDKSVDKSVDNSDNSLTIIDKSDHSTHNHYHTVVLVADPSAFTGTELPASAVPIGEEYQKNQLAFIAENARTAASSVSSSENEPQTRALLRLFKGLLNPYDYSLLRSGLYLRYLHETNVEEESKQWRLIKKNRNWRDKRVINLASAGYFDTYFRRLFKEIRADYGLEELELAKEEFRRIFEQTIETMHFVVFVSADMQVGQIIGDVNEKAEKNIKYGVRDEVIYIHAAGHEGVKHAKDAVSELKKKYVIKTITKSRGRVYKATVYYRKRKDQ